MTGHWFIANWTPSEFWNKVLKIFSKLWGNIFDLQGRKRETKGDNFEWVQRLMIFLIGHSLFCVSHQTYLTFDLRLTLSSFTLHSVHVCSSYSRARLAFDICLTKSCHVSFLVHDVWMSQNLSSSRRYRLRTSKIRCFTLIWSWNPKSTLTNATDTSCTCIRGWTVHNSPISLVQHLIMVIYWIEAFKSTLVQRRNWCSWEEGVRLMISQFPDTTRLVMLKLVSSLAWPG